MVQKELSIWGDLGTRRASYEDRRLNEFRAGIGYASQRNQREASEQLGSEFRKEVTEAVLLRLIKFAQAGLQAEVPKWDTNS